MGFKEEMLRLVSIERTVWTFMDFVLLWCGRRLEDFYPVEKGEGPDFGELDKECKKFPNDFGGTDYCFAYSFMIRAWPDGGGRMHYKAVSWVPDFTDIAHVCNELLSCMDAEWARGPFLPVCDYEGRYDKENLPFVREPKGDDLYGERMDYSQFLGPCRWFVEGREARRFARAYCVERGFPLPEFLFPEECPPEEDASPEARKLLEELDGMRKERDVLLDDLDYARRDAEAEWKEKNALREERDALQAEQGTLLEKLRRAEEERDGMREERDALEKKLEAAMAEAANRPKLRSMWKYIANLEANGRSEEEIASMLAGHGFSGAAIRPLLYDGDGLEAEAVKKWGKRNRIG